MKKNIFLFLLLIIITGCGLTSSSDEENYSELSVIRIDSIFISKNNAEFYLLLELPTPCYSDFKKEVYKDNETYRIKILGKSDPRPCIQVISSEQVKIDMQFFNSGTKNIIFDQNWGKGTIDTFIVVP